MLGRDSPSVPRANSADNIAKHLETPYLPGRRSSGWSKVKCGRRREFVVGGWSSGQGRREESIGSLALGCYDVTPAESERRGQLPRLFYVGQAGSGLNEDMIRQLQRLFARISTPTSPFVNATPVSRSDRAARARPKLHYVQPMLVVEVAYSEVTEAGTVRQPSVKGLRTDVVATEVVWDDEFAACFGS